MKMLSLITAALIFSTGCSLVTSYTVLSAAEVQKLGTRTYANTPPAAAFTATHQALEMAGYRIVVDEPATGTLKTAPKQISSHAESEAKVHEPILGPPKVTSETTVTEDSLAWNLSITASGAGSTVRAQPRGFRNGLEITDNENVWADTVITPQINALFRSIESNLPSDR